jgi:hypothetical protein
MAWFAFSGNRHRPELLDRVGSIAALWASEAPPEATPTSIGNYAIGCVLAGRDEGESMRSITHWCHP